MVEIIKFFPISLHELNNKCLKLFRFQFKFIDLNLQVILQYLQLIP